METDTQNELSSHDQEMINVADAKEAEVNDDLKTDEEKLLAGKYKSVEDLEKAYGELQSKLGAQNNENAPNEVEKAEDNQVPPLTEEQAKNEVSNAGLDFDALYNEYVNSDNSLSNETYSKLEESGINRETVDNYIKGQEAINTQIANNLKQEVGGEEEYNAMLQWASTNLSESEQQAFDSVLDNEESARFAIRGLHARFKTANPNLRTGSGNGQSLGGFSTKSEMMEAMQSPKYKSDSTYRAQVQRKVALTDFL